jgi:hypothetical protein
MDPLKIQMLYGLLQNKVKLIETNQQVVLATTSLLEKLIVHPKGKRTLTV